MTPDDEIEQLYSVRPEEFTALRKELAAAAKKRGDSDAAKHIAAARKPTTAAWVVNALVLGDETVISRLRGLAERLRASHAAMDGDAIRELSGEQRRLVDGLVRAGLAAAEVAQPSAALRDDVVGTLQAAIADPDVAARLGRLTKAETWSGFGDFGEAAPAAAFQSAREVKAKPAPVPAGPSKAEVRAAAKRRAAAAGEVDSAETAHAEATEAVAEGKARLATARRRYEKLLETLSAAEHEVNAAEVDLDTAAQGARDAAERVETSKSELAELDRAHPSTTETRAR